MDNMESFATVAFSFVLGYAERILHNRPENKYHRCKLGPNGEFVQDGPMAKSETTQKLETTIEGLHRLFDMWNGMD